jgi:hypothetical protein
MCNVCLLLPGELGLRNLTARYIQTSTQMSDMDARHACMQNAD